MPLATDLDLVTALGDGISQIRLPMAGNPMRYINGYLVEDVDGYTLVDCGWKADDVLAALEAGLAACGARITDIKRLAITHFHFDHYGLAGTLLRAGVPDLAMHPLDWNFAQLILSDPVRMDHAADQWIARNGLRVEAYLEDEIDHHRRTELAKPTMELEDGAVFGRLRAVWTPGHSPGHLCFVDSRSGRMFTGDHILDPVTPHVGTWHEGRGDALGEYNASLHKVAAIGATGVLPAHGEPFPDLQRRVEQLLEHHEEREARVIAALRTGARSAADVARALPWTRREKPFAELGEPHQQFAVAETIAHLENLRVRGIVSRDISSEPITYALCA
jgi:glyoxylase-like metal-dependent hydrolase (beta-lactamase superfamily II)